MPPASEVSELVDIVDIVEMMEPMDPERFMPDDSIMSCVDCRIFSHSQHSSSVVVRK